VNLILSCALLVTLATSLVVVIRYRHQVCRGPLPSSLFTFVAILFTSGLDVGLIMFPLVEFPVFAAEPTYAFANPLALEFGCWGFLVWASYFLTTFYFCVIEPQVLLFELPTVKLLNNAVIIATCAFTGYLLLTYLPSYVEGITEWQRYGLVLAVIGLAVCSSMKTQFVKLLSLSSTWLFFGLIVALWLASGMGVGGLATSMASIGDYFGNLHRFVTPMSDLHAFYLFWWFAWSIMIGQFVARFVGGLKTWQLLPALLVFPSVPIALWFSVLYFYYTGGLQIPALLAQAMIVVGILFVVNSIDSLTRLYTLNLDITVQRFGRWTYIAINATLLIGLTLLYQFTPFEMQWVGLVVIGLYAVIYVLLFLRRRAWM